MEEDELTSEAVALTSAFVPFTSVLEVLLESAVQLLVIGGIGPDKHLGVFHQLPQDFQGTSLAIDKKR